MDPAEIYASIGTVIRRRRKQLKLTQEKLAPLIGMSRASLANIETGRQRLLVHQLFAVASALQLEPTDLLPERTEKREQLGSSENTPLPKGNLSKVQRAQVLHLVQSESNKIRLVQAEEKELNDKSKTRRSD